MTSFIVFYCNISEFYIDIKFTPTTSDNNSTYLPLVYVLCFVSTVLNNLLALRKTLQIIQLQHVGLVTIDIHISLP